MSPDVEAEDVRNPQSMARILLIGCDSIQSASLTRGLHAHGYEIVEISDPIGVLECMYGMKGAPPDVLLINLDTTIHRSGMELIKIVRSFRPGFPIIVNSSAETVAGTDDLEASGVPVIHEPIDFQQLDRDIRALMALARTVRRGSLSL